MCSGVSSIRDIVDTKTRQVPVSSSGERGDLAKPGFSTIKTQTEDQPCLDSGRVRDSGQLIVLTTKLLRLGYKEKRRSRGYPANLWRKYGMVAHTLRTSRQIQHLRAAIALHFASTQDFVLDRVRACKVEM